ncbi:MAG: formylglycine-generating enzyme family protein, partial [Spirochaetia bacterium]|nr:formylglycine-generating enzyme family protein [Spirochaetia bacterium]
PVFGAGDAVVTLTATIEKNGVTETKTFQITVLETPQTDAESVSADKAALDFSDFMFGTGDDNTAVTQSFSVPTSGSSGTTISWSSDRDAVSIIAGTATVLQPLTLTGDVTVTLTATIEKNSVFETKVFTITVLETSSTPVVKDQVTYSVGVNYNMRYVPPKTFSTGVDDNGDINGDTIQDVATTATVAAAYLIAETEVTYELWYEVYIWAKTDAGGGVRADGGSLYKFANSGHQGGDASACGGAAVGNNQSPVTCVNWRDAIVWCNALTEYYNAQNGTSYTVVYTVDAAYTTPIRSSEDGLYGSSVNSAPGSFDNPYYNPNAKGFRLPTNNEWELAARYIADINSDGDILDANEYYPGNYASGATADHNNVAPTGEVAWYAVNAGSISHIVATRIPNALGIYDMSGNAWEWTLDWYTFGSDRMLRGGGWNSLATALQVGYVYYSSPSYEYSSMGFRLARTP